MSLMRKYILGGVLLGVLMSIVFVGSTESEVYPYQKLSSECFEEHELHAWKINCWMSVIEGAYQHDGLPHAFVVFDHLYDTYVGFATSGCHRHAHRVGDYAYYFDFLTHKDLERVEFPPSANACGYGFYHGFVEHMVQDNPEPVFVKETCTYLIDRLQETVPAIEQTCYHGSGHGFLIAQADTITDPDDMTIINFTTVPLEKCDILDLSDHLRNECREGVFNVFVDWMVEEDFGLAYDFNDPFSPCEPLIDPEAYAECSVEISRKFDFLSELNPQNVAGLVESNRDSGIHQRMFQIAISGIVQHNPTETPIGLVEQCRGVKEVYQKTCFEAVVAGLFEHGEPGSEYAVADRLCNHKDLLDSERVGCLTVSADKLYRFRNESELQSLCANSMLSPAMCERIGG